MIQVLANQLQYKIRFKKNKNADSGGFRSGLGQAMASTRPGGQ